jgi:hypothetical protein
MYMCRDRLKPPHESENHRVENYKLARESGKVVKKGRDHANNDETGHGLR